MPDCSRFQQQLARQQAVVDGLRASFDDDLRDCDDLGEISPQARAQCRTRVQNRLRDAEASLVAARNELTACQQTPDLLGAQGLITFLRVHDVGTGFGPPNDFIDVEAVIQLDSQPGRSFGFQLRNDRNRPARQGMLDLLRDAFATNTRVNIDFLRQAGRNNGIIIRVARTRP